MNRRIPLPAIPAILFLFVIGIASGFAQNPKPGTSDRVRVETRRAGDVFLVYAVNTLPYPVTVTVNIHGENYTLNRTAPATLVVKGGDRRRVFRVTIAEREKPFSINSRYSWFTGDINAVHDDKHPYRLPYREGESYELSQGFNGSFSHGGDVRYALDFNMPEGTPVVAARGGVVVEKNADFEEGGPSIGLAERSNFVVIIHDDGTFGVYAHLQKGGVPVEVGQKVSKGRLIGYSGNTGYTSGPHLHFMVTRLQKDGSSVSIPFQFRAQRGLVADPQEGEWYKAVNEPAPGKH